MNRFVSGQVYAVGTSVGSYLLAIGAAEPVADDDTVVRLSTRREQSAWPIVSLKAHAFGAPRDQAPERQRRSRRKLPDKS